MISDNNQPKLATNTEAQVLLNDLGEMSELFAHSKSESDILNQLLKKICDSMKFDLSILYHATNVVDDHLLILEVVKTFDPNKKRVSLFEGSKVIIDMDAPEKIYINEVKAFNEKGISKLSVPGVGCDIAGFVNIPSPMGKGYIFSGDYVEEDLKINTNQELAFKVLCNMLSSTVMKNHFEKMSRFDALTGVVNSGTIRVMVEDLLKKHERQFEKVSSITLVDIDHFKKVNDTYGHIQGDSVLEEFAHLISENLREGFETVGRYGGEEFLILLEDSELEKAKIIVERIREKTEKYKFSRIDENGLKVKDAFINITASFGIATFGKGKLPIGIKEMLAEVDSALYQAKDSGRNQVRIGVPLSKDATEGRR